MGTISSTTMRSIQSSAMQLHSCNQCSARGARVEANFGLVPNHMGVGGSDNPLWLERAGMGAGLTYAGWLTSIGTPTSATFMTSCSYPRSGFSVRSRA